MALFPLSGVLRRFLPATYEKYASASTLVWPCSENKMLIFEPRKRAHLKTANFLTVEDSLQQA